jgi:hypothetical protein
MNTNDAIPTQKGAIALDADDLECSSRCSYWAAAASEKKPRRNLRRINRSPLILTGHGMQLRIDHGALV